MTWFIIGLVLLVLNLWISVIDIKKFGIPKRAAFTLLVTGILLSSLLTQLEVLL
jgi:hypothetical protein